MGRIKQGLDYFPLNTDFMHDRVVRRVMKREGDSAFTNPALYPVLSIFGRGLLYSCRR